MQPTLLAAAQQMGAILAQRSLLLVYGADSPD